MAEQQPVRQPQNIFEVINQNIVDMSQDIVLLAQQINAINTKVDAIFNTLYPPITEPIAPGAEKTKQ